MKTQELENKAESTERNVSVSHDDTIQEQVSLPRTNVYASEKEIYLESELIGVNKDSLDIRLEDDLLTIYGKNTPESVEGYELKYAEFLPRSFRRQFRIEGSIDSENIKAHIKNGVLKLRVPLKEPKAKKIKIQTSE